MTVGAEARLIAYSMGNFAKNILWATAEVTLLYLLTDLLGMSPSLAGLLFLAGIFTDAVFDLLVATAAERSRSRFGQYGPFMLLGAPICALAFVMLYGLPYFGVTFPPIVIASILAFRIAYAAIDLPHTAMVGKVAPTSRARSRVAGYRFFFSSLASLLTALAVPTLLLASDQRSEHLLGLATIAGGLSTMALWGAWFAVRRMDYSPPATGLGYGREIRAALRNRALGPLALIAFCTGLSAPLFTKMALYYAQYVLERPEIARTALAAVIGGQFLGVALWTWLASRAEKTTALSAAHLVSAIAFSILALAGSVGDAVLIPGAVAVGVGLSGVYMLIWGMAPDVVDYGEFRGRVRVEATTVALLIFLMKCGIGIGAASVGALLDLSGYTPNAAQTELTKAWIVALMLWVPAGGSLLCAAITRLHPLSHARHAAIAQRLDRRRALG